MEALLNSLLQLVAAVGNVLVDVVVLLLPIVPLAVWVGYWMFAVDWTKFWRPSLWVGVVLIALLAVLVWGTVAPPADGYHSIAYLKVSNYVGKLVYVTGLVCIMLLCGAVQLAGCCDRYVRFEEPVHELDPHGHASHGHGH